jgi:peptidoglycan/LPS O-acetylase OafA/YrhL
MLKLDTKLYYRPEIDGLRAIAILSVIAYHANITIFDKKIFKGGFIGVDIFFVISGYLITSIILKELFTSGSFNFYYFYERRVRRILPVLLFVSLFSLIFSYKFLYSLSFVDFKFLYSLSFVDLSKSILYSLGFSSNFYFYNLKKGYSALDAQYQPFLHTWSLSVEEQFYILFPIFLFIIFKYFKKHLPTILFIILLISLQIADTFSYQYPNFNFFSLHSRMWELLAGSLLAYFEIKLGYRSKCKDLTFFVTVGIFLIGNYIFFYRDWPHPSLYTLSPVIGTCLIIWFSDKNDLITKLLSSKLFVGIGLISYSLYLWHYPVFAFARITNLDEVNTISNLFLILIILILSIASYYFIEKPFRNKKNHFKKISLILIATIVFLVSISFYIINKDGIVTRLPKILQAKLKEDNIIPYQRDNAQKIILIGDSHANSLAYNLNHYVKKKDLSLFIFNNNVYDSEIYSKNNKKLDNFLKNNSNLIVILHYKWKTLHHDKNKERENKERLISHIKNIVNQGHKLIIVYPVPVHRTFLPQDLLNKISKHKNNINDRIPIISSNYESFKTGNKLIFEILDSLQNPNIYRVYPHKLFCDKQIKNRCIANDQKKLFYYDNNHLSLKGSELVVDEIVKHITK